MTWESWVAMGDIHKPSLSLLEASQGIWGVGELIVATSSATSSQVAELGTVSLTTLDPAWQDAAFSTGSPLPGSLSKKVSLPHFLGPDTLSLRTVSLGVLEGLGSL